MGRYLEVSKGWSEAWHGGKKLPGNPGLMDREAVPVEGGGFGMRPMGWLEGE